MKVQKYTRLVVMVVLFVAIVLPVAGAGASGWTEVPFVGKEYLMDSTPAKITMPGGNYHERGGTHDTLEVAGNPCLDGPGFVTVKVNINKNGKVDVGGKFNIYPDAYEGIWKTKWHVTDDHLIVAVGHGTGELAGMKIEFVFDGGEGVDGIGPYMGYSGSIYLPPNAQVQCES